MSELDLRQAIMPARPSRGFYGQRVAQKHAAWRDSGRSAKASSGVLRKTRSTLAIVFSLIVAWIGGPLIIFASALKLSIAVHIFLFALPFSAFRETQWGFGTRLIAALLLGPLLVVVFWTSWFAAMLGTEPVLSILSEGPERAWDFVTYAMNVRSITVTNGVFKGVYQHETVRLLWMSIAGLICAGPLLGALQPRRAR